MQRHSSEMKKSLNDLKVNNKHRAKINDLISSNPAWLDEYPHEDAKKLEIEKYYEDHVSQPAKKYQLFFETPLFRMIDKANHINFQFTKLIMRNNEILYTHSLSKNI